MSLPSDLYTAAQVRELDRRAIQDAGIPGYVLMCRAGRAAFEALRARWSSCRDITVLAGAGNNAGDGYVIATLARQSGWQVRVWAVGDPAALKGDAAQARDDALAAGVPVAPFVPGESPLTGVLVDALLGTGLQGEVRPVYRAAIEAVNAAHLPVLAVDLPSGLCADTGRVLGEAVRADLTVSFIGLKQGLCTGRGPALAGALVFDGLAVPATVFEGLAPSARRLALPEQQHLLAPRPRDAHKGLFGHVLVIGGDHGFAGAALMAAQAAARAGAGLVSVATRPEHVSALVARCPELMAHGVVSGLALQPLLARPSVLVVGPGLGRSSWSEQLLGEALRSGLPMVVDADGLNLLAERAVLHRHNWLLTPHPGEAARLLGTDTVTVQGDRFAAVAGLQARHGGTVLLKGAGTLVCDGLGTTVCPYGNPGMASGGMGDVLSGILGGLLAQGLTPGDAARLGACLHGRAADLAAEHGERGLLATDLLGPLRHLVNPGSPA